MASVKEYAYYMQGNKIALVEKEAAFDNDPNSKDYGPGTDKFQWKSPLADVADGLEILYTYSPLYHIYQNQGLDINKFGINGWTVIDGYLAFFRSNGNAAEVNWGDSPYSAVTSGSAGEFAGQHSSHATDYIVVSGSSRWNGLHKVKTAGANGVLTTHTRVKGSLPYWENQQVDFNTDEESFDGGGGTLHLADHFAAGDYVYIGNSGQVKNNGLFSVASVTQSATAASSKITAGNKYHILFTGNENRGTEKEIAATFLADTGESGVDIYKAHRDPAYIHTNISVLDDETDEIDVPNYLSKAAVDYVKAKYLEDAGRFEEAEYLMVKFRKQLEKYNNRLIGGPRMIASGPYGIR